MDSNLDDTQILSIVKEFPSKFSLVYEKYYSRIYRYCLVRLNFSKEDAEDVVSTVFVRALRSIDNVVLHNDKDNSLLPWLYWLSRNSIVDFLRSTRKRDKDISLDEDVMNFKESDLTDTDAKDLDIEITAENIKQIIDTLDSVSRDILYMRIYEEYEFKDIAMQLNMSEASVKMRYYRYVEQVTKIAKNTLRLNKKRKKV